jgi:hypothetical protein
LHLMMAVVMIVLEPTIAGGEAQHASDVISAVAEFMVDVAVGEAQHACTTCNSMPYSRASFILTDST